jgi:two-component system, NarL family, nitrate/nitrite response regulator NarL
VLVVTEHRMFRQALAKLLQNSPDIRIVGHGVDVSSLVARIPADILLLDVCMPAASGLDGLGQLSKQGNKIHTILLTCTITRQQVIRALGMGARGVVTKNASIELLVKSIRQVMAGHYWIGDEWIGDMVEVVKGLASGPPRRPVETLTTRETQIISAVTQGATNKQVSREFGLSEQTVKNHLSSIFDKLGVSSRLELALYAISHHMVPDAGEKVAG